MDVNELGEQLKGLDAAPIEPAPVDPGLESIMAQYGDMFSGDQDIGLAILNELAARGNGAAAVGANKAVQEYLDQLRMEALALADKIKVTTAQAAEAVNNMVDQVKEVQDSVAAATGGQPVGDGVMDAPIPIDVAAPPPVEPLPGPSDAPPPIADVPAGGGSEPPGAAPPAPAGSEPPPAEAPLPPQPVASDSRVKMKLKPRTVSSGYRAPSHVLNAIRGIT